VQGDVATTWLTSSFRYPLNDLDTRAGVPPGASHAMHAQIDLVVPRARGPPQAFARWSIRAIPVGGDGALDEGPDYLIASRSMSKTSRPAGAPGRVGVSP